MFHNVLDEPECEGMVSHTRHFLERKAVEAAERPARCGIWAPTGAHWPRGVSSMRLPNWG